MTLLLSVLAFSLPSSGSVEASQCLGIHNKKYYVATSQSSSTFVKSNRVCVTDTTFSVRTNSAGEDFHFLKLYMAIDGRWASCTWQPWSQPLFGSTSKNCTYSGGRYSDGPHLIEWYWKGDIKNDGKGEITIGAYESATLVN